MMLTQAAEKITIVETVEVRAAPKKRIGARAFIETFGTNVLIQISTVLQGIIVARFLGPIGRGQITQIMLWPTIVAQFGTLGTDQSISRYAAKGFDRNALIKLSFLILSMLSICSILIGFIIIQIAAQSFSDESLKIAKICLLAIPLLQTVLILGAVDQGKGDFKRFNIARSLASPLINIFLISFWYLSFINIKTVILSYYLGAAMVAGLRIYWSVKNIELSGNKIPFAQAFKDGAPFAVTRTIDLAFQKIDQIILVLLLGSVDIGIYVVAFSIASVCSMIGNSAGMVGFVQSASDFFKTGKTVCTNFRNIFILSLMAGCVLAIIIPILVPVIYGPAFDGSILVGILLIPGLLLQSAAGYLDQHLRGKGNPLSGLTGRIIVAFLFVIVSIYLTRSFGVLGLAVGFDICQLIYLCWMISKIKQIFPDVSAKMFIPEFGDMKVIFLKIRALLHGNYLRR